MPFRRPTLLQSIFPLFILAVFLGVGYGIYNIDSRMLLIVAAAVAGLIAVSLGYTYKEIEAGILESMMKAMPAILIIIMVGAVVGSWIASGTIPMMVYYGLQIISPQFFLATACLVCSIVSLFTGSSYATIGTLGVAFIGIAEGLSMPLAPAAGAIIAGSYFGDKLSPFSDTTNLAPIAAKSNLFDHIRHMLWTTTPAWVLGLLVYIGFGFFTFVEADVSMAKSEIIRTTIREHFNFHWILFLPAVVTFYCAFRKKPVVPGLLISSLVATCLAIFIQGVDLKTAVASMATGFNAHTGETSVDKLFSRGGMLDMMNVTLIAFCAFAFGGIVQKAQMLDVILQKLLKLANTTGKLIASTVSASLVTASLTGNSYLAILIPGELFAPAFKQRNLAAKNLSRTVEDSGTVVVPLVPWSIAGVYISGTLGVPTLEYLPWAIMCYSGFIFALIYGFTGFAIAPKRREDESLQGS